MGLMNGMNRRELLLYLGATAIVRGAERSWTLKQIRVRDPFILTDPGSKTYYLYAQIGNRSNAEKGRRGVEVYTSRDLQMWSGPSTVFEVPADFWAKEAVWAPEVHRYRGRYYLFVTFTGTKLLGPKPAERPALTQRGTQILAADSPQGPFRPLRNGPHTPEDWMALDGTLWVENNTPWMIFCHEWVQIEDGTMELMKLRPDLSAPADRPSTLFRATDAAWVQSLKQSQGGNHGFVTDGPFLHRTRAGKLLMIWSSFGVNGYAIGIAESRSGSVVGPWRQQTEPLFGANGGHGMIFHTLHGRLKLVFHQPNRSLDERAQLYDIQETASSLRLKAVLGRSL